jgi:hypothetical protein
MDYGVLVLRTRSSLPSPSTLRSTPYSGDGWDTIFQIDIASLQAPIPEGTECESFDELVESLRGSNKFRWFVQDWEPDEPAGVLPTMTTM